MLKSYIICAAPRTGTNLLATALRGVGVAGKPSEYFNTVVMSRPYMQGVLGLPADGANPPDELERIVLAGTTPNGIFGATVHWPDLKHLLAIVGQSQGRTIPAQGHAPDGLRSFFPGLLYVWLRRENKVAQGISHYLAMQTGRWYELSGKPEADRRKDSEIAFDFATIKKRVDQAIRSENLWRQFLASSLDSTLDLTYEDFAADYTGTVTRVLEFLGASSDLAIPDPAYRPQRDARSIEWERRYREEAQAEMPGSADPGE